MSKLERHEDLAVARLISLTRDGKLSWHPIARPDDLLQSDSQRVSIVFACEYEDYVLRLYRVMEKQVSFDPPLGGLLGSAVSGLSGLLANPPRVTETGWRADYLLQIASPSSHQALWTFPYSASVRHLWDAVSKSASGANDLIAKLVAEQ